MKKFIGIITVAIGLGACSGEPPVAGLLSSESICNTAGFLIRQELGKNVKTINQKCTVTVTAGDQVSIDSGYVSPINNTSLRYTAIGSVSGDRLTLRQIKVHGIDDQFIDFTSLGG